VDEDFYSHRRIFQKLRNSYRNLILEERKSTLAIFKELTGLQSKFIIPSIEYFDAMKLTIRVAIAEFWRPQRKIRIK
jgi:hypothetical protein